MNALQQVVARKGAPIIIADSSVPESDLAGMKHVLRVPRTVDCVQNILTVIPLQLLSYHIAELNGANVSFHILSKSKCNIRFFFRWTDHAIWQNLSLLSKPIRQPHPCSMTTHRLSRLSC